MMKMSEVLLPIAILLFLFAPPACAQESLWEELSARVNDLYRQGKYSEAAGVAEDALKVAEKTFGTDHDNVATSLNNLA